MLHIVPAAAADAVNRIPKHCWVGPNDGSNDYPGFGVWAIEVTEEDEDGNDVTSYRGVGEDEEPTHMMWSGRLGAAHSRPHRCHRCRPQPCPRRRLRAHQGGSAGALPRGGRRSRPCAGTGAQDGGRAHRGSLHGAVRDR